jgi:LPS-assembly protein
MRNVPAAALFITIILAAPVRAAAQQAAPPESTTADQQNRIAENHFKFSGHFEYERGDVKLYAEEAELFSDENRLMLTGNVVMRQGNNQISADRANFDTKTRLGTFYNANGFASVKQPRQTVTPGGVAPPPLLGEDTIVLFFGETVEKIGPRKYKIVSGGFTTCVQPTPRWDLHADTIVLNLDHYTLLKQVVMNVKGVPLFYLPVLYYPTKREDRATGFLLPTYGTTTLQGHSIHNAFFWAINRSQDATILHDWFSKTGQGVGTEYRYNFGGGSDGILRAHLLDQHATTALQATRSYQLNGAANQLLPGRLRASARVDYFSSIATNQTFNTNIIASSQSQRSYGGNVSGAWGSYSLNGTIDHREFFYDRTSSAVSGSWPRVNVTRNERPIQNTPFYVSAGGEYVSILSDRKDPFRETDLGLQRFDFSPQIRFPFKKWQWFTVNTTANWRDTYYTRSYDPATVGTTELLVSDANLNRQFFTLQSQITGPVFNRIWDTPDNGYAEKFKHSIEPSVTVMRTSLIDIYPRIVKLEGGDQIVGGATQFTYGIANRFYAKRRSAVAGQPAQAREIFTVNLQQAYYSNEEAQKVDPQFSTSNSGATASHFSPISLSVRAQPTIDFNATANALFDSRYHALRTVTVAGNYAWSTQVQSAASWTKTGCIPELQDCSNPNARSQSLNGSSTVRTRNNKYGAIHSFTYDVSRSMMIQQKISGFYNAQCCGIAFEFQNWHYGGSGLTSLPADHRFFMSFTLAGLGNFSPFNGALGGVTR